MRRRVNTVVSLFSLSAASGVVPVSKAQIPLDSTRSTCRASREELVEPCCSNMADDEQSIVLACTSLIVFMLYTQILFVPSKKYIKLMYTPIN